MSKKNVSVQDIDTKNPNKVRILSSGGVTEINFNATLLPNLTPSEYLFASKLLCLSDCNKRVPTGTIEITIIQG